MIDGLDCGPSSESGFVAHEWLRLVADYLREVDDLLGMGIGQRDIHSHGHAGWRVGPLARIDAAARALIREPVLALYASCRIGQQPSQFACCVAP